MNMTPAQIEEQVTLHQRRGAAAHLKAAGYSDAAIKTKMATFTDQLSGRLARRKALHASILSAE